MLRLQEKLFFRSVMRSVLLLVLLGGCIIYNVYLLVWYGTEDIVTWGAGGIFAYQMRVYFFHFVIVAMLAFDYFREVPDAELLEVIKVGNRGFKSDCMQFLVIMQYVFLSTVIMLAFSIYFFSISVSLTSQLVLYLCKINVTYMLLNGLAAILFGWLLSRRVNKIAGYVILLFFCVMLTSNMAENLKTLSYYKMGILKYFRGFFLFPEGFLDVDGMAYADETVLFPVHFSQMLRVIFWICLFGTGIISCYRFARKKLCITVFGIMTLVSFYFMIQPGSYFSKNNAADETDSYGYDQRYYMLEMREQRQKETDFVIERYEMKIRLTLNMETEVVLYLSQPDLEQYDMTLYHLYDVEKVTNQEGISLDFVRDGDYLTIQNPKRNLESVTVTYRGGCANFYSNAEELYLPAWFPYYPIAGFHRIYEENYLYADNRLDTEAEFDVTFDSRARIYSELPEVSENHFAGKSRGAVFVSGFYKKVRLENGIICIYPYLNKMYDPYTETNKVMVDNVAKNMVESGKWKDCEDKTIVFVPMISGDGLPYVTEQAIVSDFSWETLEQESTEEEMFAYYYEGAVETTDENMQIFNDWYWFTKEENPEVISYASVREFYASHFEKEGDIESLNEEFEQYFIENMGEEELEFLKGGKQDAGN